MTADPSRYVPPPAAEQLQAVLLAALCGVLFLGPALLPGRALVPYVPEVAQPLRAEALAAGRVTLDDLRAGNRGGGDKYNQSLAWDRITQQALRRGRLPLWTRDLGGGASFVPQMAQIYQPWTLLLLLVPSVEVYGPWFLLHQIVIGLLAYRFLRRIGCRHAAGLLGVACVVLGLWMQARVHHNVIVSAALPLFGMLSCVHQLFVYRGGARTAGLLGLGVGLSWLGGMPQISLLGSYLVGAYALVLAVPQGRRAWRPLLWTSAGTVAGGLIGLAQMGPVLVAAAESARLTPTPAQLTSRSLEAGHLLSLVWPDLLSWPAEFVERSGDAVRAPWAALLVLDPQHVVHGVHEHTENAYAIGIPGAVLALVGVTHRRRHEALLFAAVAVFGFAMAAAAGPLPWLTRVLPGTASGDLRRFVYLCAMALPVLAALGFDRVLERDRAGPAIAAAAAIAVLSGALLAVHCRDADGITNLYAPRMAAKLAPLVGLDDLSAAEAAVRAKIAPGEAEANREHLLATYGRSAAVAAAAVLLLLLRRRRWARGALVLLAVAELAHAGHGTVLAVPSERVTTPPKVLGPALAATRAARGPRPRFQRLAAAGDRRPGPLLRPNLGAFYGLEDMAAYNPLPPLRMEELFQAIEPDRPGKAGVAFGGAGVDLFRDPQSLRHPLLDVLGIRWILSARQLTPPGLVDRTPAVPGNPFKLYERTTCLPRATFVARVRIEPDRDRRLALLADPERDAGGEVVLEDPEAPRPDARAGAGHAEVRVTEDRDERVAVQVSNDVAGYLRLADPWDPGWRVRVDGATAALYVADHYLRAVYLPPGEHRVVFTFDGTPVTLPRRLALLGLLLALGLLIGPAFRRRTAEIRPGPDSGPRR